MISRKKMQNLTIFLLFFDKFCQNQTIAKKQIFYTVVVGVFDYKHIKKWFLKCFQKPFLLPFDLQKLIDFL